MRNHAQIAVAGFAGMDKKCGGAGGRQCGGDFAADVAGFAHAGHHHAAPACQYQLQRAHKIFIQTRAQIAHGVGFDIQYLARKLQHMFSSRGGRAHGQQVY